MKKLLLYLLLVPTLALGQVSSWRGGAPQRQMPSIAIERSDVSNWRNSTPREFNRPPQTKPGSNIVIRDPWLDWGWGWNRWGMWGAPMFGWNYWQPSWYWNDFGYRQPQRIYVYDNGKRDTIRGKKPIINFVLHKTSNNQIGGAFAIGNKAYFIADFVTTYQPDHSTYFPYGTIDKVDFPLINDLVKQGAVYIGGGQRWNRTGFHAMLGFGKERVFWRGKDKLGEITFPKYQSNFTTIKVGVMHDIKNFTIKVDADPIRNYWQAGLGLNL